MAASMLRGQLRDASSPCTLLLLLVTVSLLLASYWSSSSERFALRAHEARLLARIRTDATSMAVLVNATRRLDQRLRDAMRRAVRLTRDNEEYKASANRLKKVTARLKKHRVSMLKKRESLIKIINEMKRGKGNMTAIKGLENEYFDEGSSSFNYIV